MLRLRRFLFFVGGDVLVLTGALLLSFLVSSANTPILSHLSAFPALLVLSLVIKLPLLRWQGLYAVNWSFVALEDLVGVVRALTVGSMGLAAVALPLWALGVLEFSPPLLLLDYTFGLLGVGGFRIARRIYLQSRQRPTTHGEVTLIVGAGSAGTIGRPRP